MAFEDYQTKKSVAVAYTGDGKGKTTASIGLTVRALGKGWNVAFIQFVKHWKVSEHNFFETIAPIYKDKFYFYKGGKGFYDAGDLSAKNVTKQQHKEAALATYNQALQVTQNGNYDLVICDEINNAVHDGLLTSAQLKKLLKGRNPKTSICVTGRNFPDKLLPLIDIATDMRKIKHHFDEKYLANEGIDY